MILKLFQKYLTFLFNKQIFLLKMFMHVIYLKFLQFTSYLLLFDLIWFTVADSNLDIDLKLGILFFNVMTCFYFLIT